MGVQRSQRGWSMAARDDVAGEEWRQEPALRGLRRGERSVSGVSLLEQWQICSEEMLL